VIQELKKAVDILKEEKVGYLIPEVSSNLGYALPNAEGSQDVAAFPGRIVRFKDSIAFSSDPEFGGSKHIAKTGILHLSAVSSRKSPLIAKRMRRAARTHATP
jgi:predicted fused transcriptional regulator/phosphomethylpyrimidine kinase